MAERIRVLLIEDNPGEARLPEALLAGVRPEIQLQRTDRLAEGLQALARSPVDLVLLDLSLPGGTGSETLARTHAAAPTVPIVVLTGLDDDDAALEAMKRGAQDYLVKGKLDASLLARSIRYAIERKRAEESAVRLLAEQAARVEAEAAEARARFSASASDLLASSLDYLQALPQVAGLAVPFLADRCTLDVFDELGAPMRVASAPPEGPDPAPLDPSRQGTWTTLALPLVARGRRVGLLSLGRPATRPFTSEEHVLAFELARRVALAVDNARLYRAREEVLRIVSHDLRNPLNVISLAAASLARSTLSAPMVAKQCDKITRAVARMNHLISDLLDLAKLDGSAWVMTKSKTDAGGLVSDACEMMRLLADEKGILLRKEEPAEPLAPIEVDRERILQVLSNLIGNAIKFTPAGGQITIAVRPEGDALHFEVSDTGPGIARQDLPRVFERFWQGDAERQQGTGLGLSIAKAIVQAHGGQIQAHSGPGGGSTFSFWLPSSDGTSRAEQTPAEAPPAHPW